MNNFELLEAETPVLPQRFAGMIQIKNISGRTIVVDSKGNYLIPESYAAVSPFDSVVVKQISRGLFLTIEFSIDNEDLSQKPNVNKIPKKKKVQKRL